MTPATTVYTGYTVVTTDAAGIQLEQKSGIKLNSLTPRTLNAKINQTSDSVAAINDFYVAVKSMSECDTCAVEIAGPGLSDATCPACIKLSPTSIRFVSSGIAYEKLYEVKITQVRNPSSVKT